MNSKRQHLPVSLWGRFLYARIAGDLEYGDTQARAIRSQTRPGGREQFEIAGHLFAMLFRQVFEQEPEVSEIDALIGEARSVLRTPEHMPFLEAEALARSWLGEPHVDTSGISSVVTATTGAVLAARLAKRLRLSARQIAEAVVIAEREVETMGIELVLE